MRGKLVLNFLLHNSSDGLFSIPVIEVDLITTVLGHQMLNCLYASFCYGIGLVIVCSNRDVLYLEFHTKLAEFLASVTWSIVTNNRLRNAKSQHISFMASKATHVLSPASFLITGKRKNKSITRMYVLSLKTNNL